MDGSRARVAWLTLLAVVASGVCVALGLWQGQRTQDILEAERAAVSAPIPVSEAMTADGYPGESIGRPVTADGTYDLGAQVLVSHREWQGRDGAWVVTPLRTGGSIVAVLRGWVPGAESPDLAGPTGPVLVSGVLQPFEEFYSDVPVRPDGQFVAISRAAIEQAWQGPVLPLVVVLKSEEPASSPAPQPVPPTVQTSGVPFPLQNAAYTIQWFVFAIFVWVMWWMWLRRPSAPQQTADRLES
ncbi:MAG: SURF1 family protein [Candidatus Nanopelagicales bacterium]